jgi:hypothetical protein
MNPTRTKQPSKTTSIGKKCDFRGQNIDMKGVKQIPLKREVHSPINVHVEPTASWKTDTKNKKQKEIKNKKKRQCCERH